MSKISELIKDKAIDYTSYDPVVFDNKKTVLQQLEIIKSYMSTWPVGFIVWGVVEFDSFRREISTLNLYPIGRGEDIGEPKEGDLVIFRDGAVHEITNIRQTGPNSFSAILDTTVLINLKGPQGQSIKGDPGVGVQDLASISFPYGVADITYDSTEGIHMFGGARLTFNNGIEPVEAAAEIEIPLQPGEGIVLDANENNDGVSIGLDAETNALLGRAIVAPINGVAEDSVPIVKPNRDVDYVPVSSLGGSSVCLFSTSLYQNTLSGYYYLYPPKEAGIKKIEITSIRYNMYTMGGEEPKAETFSNPVVIYENGAFVQSFNLYVNYENKDFSYEDYNNGYSIYDFSGYSGIGPSTVQFTFKVYF